MCVLTLTYLSFIFRGCPLTVALSPTYGILIDWIADAYTVGRARRRVYRVIGVVTTSRSAPLGFSYTRHKGPKEEEKCETKLDMGTRGWSGFVGRCEQ